MTLVQRESDAENAGREATFLKVFHTLPYDHGHRQTSYGRFNIR